MSAYSPNSPGTVNVFNPPIIAQRAPLATDTGFPKGQTWIDDTTNSSWQLTSFSSGSAVWTALGGGATAVDQLDGDTGSATPTGGAITIAGTADELVTSATGSTVTVAFVPSVIFTQGNVSVVRDEISGDVTFTVQNTDATMTDSQAIIRTVTDTAGGDSFFQASVSGGQTVSFGIDNGSGDNFVMSNSTALGTNNFFSFSQSDSSSTFGLGNVVVTRAEVAGLVALQIFNTDAGATSESMVRIGTGTADAFTYYEHDGSGVNWSTGSQVTTDDYVIAQDLGLTNNIYLRAVATTGDIDIPVGNLSISGAGKQIEMESGAATDFIGSAVLIGGTIAVANTNIKATDQIMLTVSTPGGVQGILSYAITPSTSFTITSTSGADTSTVEYRIVNKL